jgi:adenosylmethionine-8-amino-7-oxononanoate aminotransferase
MMLHFTKTKAWRAGTLPTYVRGEGCHVWDDTGRRYFDGLAGLFVVQIGHGRADIAAAAAKQMELLAYTPTWGAAHPPAVEAAKLVTSLAPDGLDIVFFVTSGSEAVESALKLSRQYHAARGNPTKTGVISRDLSYHGTTMGALSVTGLTSITTPFEPLLPGFHKVPSTLGYDDGRAAAAVFEEAVLAAGPEHIGLIAAEPVQNSGGCLVPPDGYWAELRRICDEYDILLLADEVITGFGRIGRWFAAERFGGKPDLITFAKGATSGYAPVGGLLAHREVAETVLDSDVGMFSHGATWGGHPVSMAVTLANISAMRDEGVIANVNELEGYFQDALAGLCATHPVAEEWRGAGYFYAITLRNSDGSPFDADTSSKIVDEVAPRLIREAGLLIRADARGQAKLVLSPPLIAGKPELDELLGGVDRVLAGVADHLAG